MVKIKARTSHIVLHFCTMLMLIGTANAARLSLQPRLEVGVMSYSFESEQISDTYVSDPVPQNNGLNYTQQLFEYNGNLNFIGVGGTIFLGRFFLDVSGQYARDGQDRETVGYSGYLILDYDEDSQYVNTSFMAAEPVHDVSFDRQDMALSLGYSFGSQSSIFVGYKWTTTQFDTTYQGPLSLVNYNIDDDLDGPAGGRVWGDAQFSFVYQGPFIGAVQGWDFRPCRLIQGIFTTRLALAYLHGKVSLDRHTDYVSITWVGDQQVPETVREIEGGGVANRYDTKGDSVGLTLGIAWRGSTKVDGLSYNIGISGYRYEFDAQDNSQSDINETCLVYKIGIAYVF
jgi:hypothetical protein